MAMTVNELIDSAIGQWNRALVWATFNQSNAAIVKIHLSNEARREELLWILEKSGAFTMKSMYRELIKPQEAPFSSVDLMWWRKLWRMQVHERIKIIL